MSSRRLAKDFGYLEKGKRNSSGNGREKFPSLKRALGGAKI